MPRAKAIVFALRSLCESADTARKAQGVHFVKSACEHLVNVALMSNVENDMVVRRVENSVYRHSQLNHAKIGSKMTSVLRNSLYKLGAYLLRKLTHSFFGQSLKIVGGFYIIQIYVFINITHLHILRIKRKIKTQYIDIITHIFRFLNSIFYFL